MNTTQKTNLRAKAAGGYITLPPMTKNKHAEVYYRKALDQELGKMLDSMINEIKRAYTTIPVSNAKMSDAERIVRLRRILKRLQTQYGKQLDKNVEKIIKKYLQLARRSAYASIEKAFDNRFSVQFNARQYARILKIAAQKNALLINTTSTQVISNVTNITFDGVTAGLSWKQVEKDLRKQHHIGQDRIKRIARDQTAKLNENLNEMAMRDAGVEYFEWMTAHDERVSKGYGGHEQLNGKIYKWGDDAHYPIIDTYGNRGVPGQRVNCRCTAVGVILQKDYEAHRTSEGDWIITKGRL